MNANVSFLARLVQLDKYKMVVNNVHNVLECHCVACKVPAMKNNGDIYIYCEWQKRHNLLFTYAEQRKLHKNFSLPSPHKLFNLLKLAQPRKTDSGTIKNLEISNRDFDDCKRLSRGPVRLRVSLPSEGGHDFEDELPIEIMFLDGDEVLDIVDTATRFSAATFLDKYNATCSQSVKGIWLAFVVNWSLVYSAYPSRP